MERIQKIQSQERNIEKLKKDFSQNKTMEENSSKDLS